MRRPKSEFPVGATWTGELLISGKVRAIGVVWLYERHDNLEVWKYSWQYPDNSWGGSDWSTSKSSAVSMCKTEMRAIGGGLSTLKFADKIRFKRVK